jgi:hypothetical protein
MTHADREQAQEDGCEDRMSAAGHRRDGRAPGQERETADGPDARAVTLVHIFRQSAGSQRA